MRALWRVVLVSSLVLLAGGAGIGKSRVMAAPLCRTRGELAYGQTIDGDLALTSRALFFASMRRAGDMLVITMTVTGARSIPSSC